MLTCLPTRVFRSGWQQTCNILYGATRNTYIRSVLFSSVLHTLADKVYISKHTLSQAVMEGGIINCYPAKKTGQNTLIDSSKGHKKTNQNANLYQGIPCFISILDLWMASINCIKDGTSTDQTDLQIRPHPFTEPDRNQDDMKRVGSCVDVSKQERRFLYNDEFLASELLGKNKENRLTSIFHIAHQ